MKKYTVKCISVIPACVCWCLFSSLLAEFDILESTGWKIVGYADKVSVAPGETVRFFVSTQEAEFRADLVRLIHGDVDPAGPGFKEERIDSPLSRSFQGRHQTWESGSYVLVEDHDELDLNGSFTIQMWVFPTTPSKGAQGLVTKWSESEGGYGLVIDDQGALSLWLSDGKGNTSRVSSETPFQTPVAFNGGFQVPDANWYFVAASYDSEAGSVTLVKEPLSLWPGEEIHAVREVAVELAEVGINRQPLIIAGYPDPDGSSRVLGHYNGKIDRPRIFGRALTLDELEALRGNMTPESIAAPVVAAWDFSRDVSSSMVRDSSQNRLDGRVVNMPQRAMTGANWNSRKFDFKEAPEQYGAIYFHEDDLRDAGWQSDVELTVPAGMRSGFYALRVRVDGGEDHIPFFVHPPVSAAKAKIAFLVPTFTYLAYSNIGNACPACRAAGSRGLYHRHSDGSGVAYTTRLRPILDLRPEAVTRWRAGGTTPRHFSGDLYMVDWLEAKGFEYEVITDHDLHREGLEILKPYRVVVTGSHPEYVSEQMLDALELYLIQGGRLMYLGGNGFYWVTSVSPDEPNYLEIRRWGGSQGWEAAPGEYYHSTTGELGGLWRFRGRPPQKLVGVGFASQGFDRNAPYERSAESYEPRYSFIFEGVGREEMIGDFPSLGIGSGAAGDEIDRLEYGLGTRAGVKSLATSKGVSDAYLLVVEDLLQSRPNLGGSVHPNVRADMVYFKYPAEGAVFSVGSISWFECLSANNYSNNVSRITENVLREFSTAKTLP